jgi:hypothetical protein
VKIPLVLVLVLAALAVAQQNDWLIVPGQRIGPITANTGRADLERMFGKANIRDQNVDYGEGDIRPGTMVYPGKPTALLTIFWPSERINNRLVQNRSRIGTITICNALYYETPACKWHTAEGVTLGTSLEKLESLNGRPFQIIVWRFGEGGGLLFSWQGGRLSQAMKFLRLDLEPRVEREGWSSDQKRLEDSIKIVTQTLEGGGGVDTMSSNDPSVMALRPRVAEMVLGFPPAK